MYKVNCQTFTESVATFRGTRITNDAISGAIVEPNVKEEIKIAGACNPGDRTDAVAVYQYPDLAGDCRILSIGTYSNSKQMNFKNDTVSSIEFGRNSKIHISVCTHSEFGGPCETLRATDLNRGRCDCNALGSPSPIHTPHHAARLTFIRSSRAACRAIARLMVTAPPVPKYISSGVCPSNAECGITSL